MPRIDDNKSPSRSTDLWGVALGLAVVALTVVTGLGWIESRRLGQRMANLERAGSGAAMPSPIAREDSASSIIDAEVSIRDAAFKGDPAAAVAMIEFSDFECPFCARYYRDTFRMIEQKYVTTGKIRYVFRHFPLEGVHTNAFRAAEIAECGRRQGLFWPVHDRFFGNQRLLRDSDLIAQAVSLGVDIGTLQVCLQGPAGDRVRADIQAGRDLGAAGTPLFLIGTTSGPGLVQAKRIINGARPFEAFEQTIEELLARR